LMIQYNNAIDCQSHISYTDRACILYSRFCWSGLNLHTTRTNGKIRSPFITIHCITLELYDACGIVMYADYFYYFVN
jgi:hypothetical protein